MSQEPRLEWHQGPSWEDFLMEKENIFLKNGRNSHEVHSIWLLLLRYKGKPVGHHKAIVIWNLSKGLDKKDICRNFLRCHWPLRDASIGYFCCSVKYHALWQFCLGLIFKEICTANNLGKYQGKNEDLFPDQENKNNVFLRAKFGHIYQQCFYKTGIFLSFNFLRHDTSPRCVHHLPEPRHFTPTGLVGQGELTWTWELCRLLCCE